MTRSCTSGRHGADEHRPTTHTNGVAKRRTGFRVAAAVFGIFVVAAVMLTDGEVRPGSTAALIRDFPQLQSSVRATIGIALAPVDGSRTPLSLGE